MVKTEAQAADRDLPLNPVALEALRQVPTLTFEGQTYTLEQLGFALEACFDDEHQQLLCEGLVFLCGAHDNLEWYQLGKLRLRNMARMAEEDSDAGGLPRGLLPAWAELCAQPALPARIPYAYHSLVTFRLFDCRPFVYILEGYRAQQPYRTLFTEAKELVEVTRLRYWLRKAPKVFAAFHRECLRLQAATGKPCPAVMDQAEATILAAEESIAQSEAYDLAQARWGKGLMRQAVAPVHAELAQRIGARWLADARVELTRWIRPSAGGVHRALVQLTAPRGVREPDAAVRMHDDIVGRIERFTLKFLRQNRVFAIGGDGCLIVTTFP